MYTIRPSVKEQILRELDNTPFGKDLFEVKIQEEDYLISVTYLPKKNFNFVLKELTESKNVRNKFLTLEAPGDWTLEQEEFEHEHFQPGRNRIIHWARRIEEDYKASLSRPENYETIRSQLFEGFDKKSIPEGERFSNEEKEKMDHRLSDLQDKMEKLYNKENATNHQLGLMRQQIRRLKDSIEILDKRTWILAAANRVLNIYKEVRAAVNEVKVLTSEIDNLLPDLSNGNESTSQDIEAS